MLCVVLCLRSGFDMHLAMEWREPKKETDHNEEKWCFKSQRLALSMGSKSESRDTRQF